MFSRGWLVSTDSVYLLIKERRPFKRFGFKIRFILPQSWGIGEWKWSFQWAISWLRPGAALLGKIGRESGEASLTIDYEWTLLIIWSAIMNRMFPLRLSDRAPKSRKGACVKSTGSAVLFPASLRTVPSPMQQGCQLFPSGLIPGYQGIVTMSGR